MKYDVLNDFELPGGKAEPVLVKAGSVWIPAETGVPKSEVSRLLNDGSISLVKKAAPPDVETVANPTDASLEDDRPSDASPAVVNETTDMRADANDPRV